MIKTNPEYVLKHNWTYVSEKKLRILQCFLYRYQDPWSQWVKPSKPLSAFPSLLPHTFYHLYNFSNYLYTITPASFLLPQPWCDLPLSLTEIIIIASQPSLPSSASPRSNLSYEIGPDLFSKKSVPIILPAYPKIFTDSSFIVHCVKIISLG